VAVTAFFLASWRRALLSGCGCDGRRSGEKEGGGEGLIEKEEERDEQEERMMRAGRKREREDRGLVFVSQPIFFFSLYTSCNLLGVVMRDLGGQVHVRVGADAVEERREGGRGGEVVRFIVD